MIPIRRQSRPIILNQVSQGFGAALAKHPSRPQIIDHFDRSRPWDIPAGVEIMFTYSMPAWRDAPDPATDLSALNWVQTSSAGVEIYPEWLTRGRIFTCGRGLNSSEIADYALAAILRVEKDLESLRVRDPADWTDRPVGSLSGKVLGLIGYGAIGQDVAKRARAFGMRVAVNRRGAWRSDDPAVQACATPAEVIEQADHLVLAVPLTNETRGVVDTSLLSRAKPGLHLINVSRGALVDQEALLQAIDMGRLSGATLDVTSPEPLPQGHPLWLHPKVLLTPHISYRGMDDEPRFLAKALANLQAYLDGAPMTDRVDSARGY